MSHDCIHDHVSIVSNASAMFSDMFHLPPRSHRPRRPLYTRRMAPLQSLPVFFDRRMVPPLHALSPDARKPAEVIESWRRLELPLLELAVTPATVDELARAHERRYVERVLAGRAANGFGKRDLEVASSLRFTSGAMLAATRLATALRLPAAIAPCAGFHHAGYAHGGRFGTFNGLMVAATAVHAEGLAQRVGILDCDMGYGSGTDEIIEELGASSWVRHFTAGATFGRGGDAREFLSSWLPKALEAMRDCDVVLYQAGAEPRVDGPLGGLLDTEQLCERDNRVFRELSAWQIPVVWSVAGGYDLELDRSIARVLASHDSTLVESAVAHLEHEALGFGEGAM
jgi:acetoin utilization deacetylase AcuC-like enzyme